MVATWPRTTMLLPFGSCFCAAAVIFPISAATPPPIPSLDAGINVDDPLNVIVGDNGRLLTPAHGGQIFQKLRLEYDRRVDRNGPQRIDRVHLILRSLHRDPIADSAV